MTAILGCAHVSGNYPTTSSFLITGFERMKSIGFRSVKLYLSPAYTTDYPNQTWSSTPTTIKELAQTTQFSSVFSDPLVNRFFLSTFSFANTVNLPFVNAVTPTQLNNEYQEIYDLATHLLSTYSNKTFVIGNWEGDWALLGQYVPAAQVPPHRTTNMAAFYQVRQKAINDARRNVTSSSQVLHSIECNRVLDYYSYRVHSHVLPLVNPDMVSLSSYEAINTWGTQTQTEQNIDRLLSRQIKKVKEFAGNYRPIYIGEYGWPETDPSYNANNLTASGLIQQTIDTANRFGLTDVIYWQIYDNDGRLYALVDSTGSYTGAGNKFVSLFS